VTNLVIVESPAKAKTIKKYLGPNFEVLASFGHVRQLPRKSGAVNTANNFAMQYQLIEKNAKHVNAIVTAMQKADTLYLATDPDREGEAISWHLSEILQDKNLLTNKQVYEKMESIPKNEEDWKQVAIDLALNDNVAWK
jgi:DNA topoisomerase-1